MTKTNWKLNNFVVYLIKDALDIEEAVYLDTDRIEVEIDGGTVLYYIPVEFGHELVDIRLTIFPDFTYNITIY